MDRLGSCETLADLLRTVADIILDDPRLFQEMTASPLFQFMRTNIELICQIIKAGGSMQKVIDTREEIRKLLSKPDLLRQTMDEMMRNPVGALEMIVQELRKSTCSADNPKLQERCTAPNRNIIIGKVASGLYSVCTNGKQLPQNSLDTINGLVGMLTGLGASSAQGWTENQRASEEPVLNNYGGACARGREEQAPAASFLTLMINMFEQIKKSQELLQQIMSMLHSLYMSCPDGIRQLIGGHPFLKEMFEGNMDISSIFQHKDLVLSIIERLLYIPRKEGYGDSNKY